jgi:hypothetical protein
VAQQQLMIGESRHTEIARRLQIGRTSVRRIPE